MKITRVLSRIVAASLKRKEIKLVTGALLLMTVATTFPALSRPVLDPDDPLEPVPSPTSTPPPPVPAPHPTPPPVITPPLAINGCTVVPDNLPGVFNFTQACNNHDLCYGAQLGKSQCDVTFFKEMNKYCTDTYTSYNPQRELCQEVAVKYYLGVQALGGPFYGPSPNTVLMEILDSNGVSHGFIEFRPDGTNVLYASTGTIFELPPEGSTAWILNDQGQRVGQLNNYTLRQDSAGNIVGIEGTSPNGDRYRISNAPADGTIINARDNSTGTWQRYIYNASGNLTFIIDSERGVINPNDGWGGNNPFDASIQTIPGFFGGGGGSSGGDSCYVGAPMHCALVN